MIQDGFLRELLLVPVGLLVVVTLRNVVGLLTFDVFTPILLAFVFREISFPVGFAKNTGQNKVMIHLCDLEKSGLLGINRRNISYLLDQNPASLYWLVDDKLKTKELLEKNPAKLYSR